jgi:DNA-binding MarR family transcriptional regulator
MATQDPDTDAVVADLRFVYASTQQLIVPEWLKLDLTMAQFKALVAVERSSGIGVCGLGSELSIGESAASLLVDQLVRRGYVGRKTDPRDRRRVLLGITSRGEKRLRALRQGSGDIVNEWLAQLGKDDLEALAHGLRALAEVVSAKRTAGPDDATVENAEP